METTPKQRTAQQNKALHKYIGELSLEMMSAGQDLNAVLKEGYKIPATADVIKAVIIKPLCKVMFGVDSTTKLTSPQITELYDVVNKNFGERVGIHVPFPSREAILTDKPIENHDQYIENTKRVEDF